MSQSIDENENYDAWRPEGWCLIPKNTPSDITWSLFIFI